jgi:hypothetical protein
MNPSIDVQSVTKTISINRGTAPTPLEQQPFYLEENSVNTLILVKNSINTIESTIEVYSISIDKEREYSRILTSSFMDTFVKGIETIPLDISTKGVFLSDGTVTNTVVTSDITITEFPISIDSDYFNRTSDYDTLLDNALFEVSLANISFDTNEYFESESYETLPYRADLSGGASLSISSDYLTATSTGKFATALWDLAALQAIGGKYYLEHYSTATYAMIPGIQTTPTRVGNYHGGTGVNGNGGVQTNYIGYPLNEWYPILIDFDNKQISFNNEPFLPFPDDGTIDPPLFLSMCDASSGVTGYGTWNFGGTPFVYEIPPGYEYIGISSVPFVEDFPFANVSLLLDMEPRTYDATSITDLSEKKHEITSSGVVELSAEQVFREEGSLKFNGQPGSHLVILNDTSLQVSEGTPFSIELAFYLNSEDTDQVLISKDEQNGVSLGEYSIYFDSVTKTIKASVGGSGALNEGVVLSSTATVSSGSWNYLSLVYDGTDIKLFLTDTSVVNPVLLSFTGTWPTTSSDTYTTTAQGWNVGDISTETLPDTCSFLMTITGGAGFEGQHPYGSFGIRLLNSVYSDQYQIEAGLTWFLNSGNALLAGVPSTTYYLFHYDRYAQEVRTWASNSFPSANDPPSLVIPISSTTAAQAYFIMYETAINVQFVEGLYDWSTGTLLEAVGAVLQDTIAAPTGIHTSTSPLYIGESPAAASSRPLNGYLDEVRITQNIVTRTADYVLVEPFTKGATAFIFPEYNSISESNIIYLSLPAPLINDTELEKLSVSIESAETVHTSTTNILSEIEPTFSFTVNKLLTGATYSTPYTLNFIVKEPVSNTLVESTILTTKISIEKDLLTFSSVTPFLAEIAIVVPDITELGFFDINGVTYFGRAEDFIPDTGYTQSGSYEVLIDY